jgi:hypothetical protein
MVNEYRNGSGLVDAKMVQDEYIEFVVAEHATASQLASLRFGDSNDTTSLLQSSFQLDEATLSQVLLSAGRSTFAPGTLVVVKGTGLGPQNLSYAPSAASAADHDSWSIELLAGQGASSSGSAINGNISLGNHGDVVWISTTEPGWNTDLSGVVHALGHDSAPGVVATNVAERFGSGTVVASITTSGNSVSNMGGATSSARLVATATLAVPNGESNSTWVADMRSTLTASSAPEPSRALLLLAGGLSLLCHRRRRV